MAGLLALGWVIAGAPSPQQMWRSIQAFWSSPAAGTHFTILVADLSGDDAGRTQTRLLGEALGRNPGLDVHWVGRVLSPADVGSVRDALEQAERTGAEWLEERNADVLIWGRAIGNQLQLRSLPRSGGRSGTLAQAGLGAALELPVGFSEALAVQIEAVTLALVAPATEAQGTFLVEVLRPVTGKLQNLLQDSLSIAPEVRAGLAHSYGLALMTIGEQSGENALLEEAVTAFRAALQERTRERVPLQWAATQSSLGTALVTLGERESGTARLEEAVEAYRAALQVRTRELHPLLWAATQHNLGTALWVLGERASGRAERHVWRRRSLPFELHCKSRADSGCHSTGP